MLITCLGALLALAPLWGPLVLSAWVAILAHPLHVSLTRKLGGRGRAAGTMTVSLVLIALVPLGALTVSLTGSAIDLAQKLMATTDGAAALRALVASADNGPRPPSLEGFDVGSLTAMVQRHGASAWRVLSVVAGAATTLVVGFFVFVLGVHEFLVNGPRAYDWLVEHSPVPRATVHRFAGAFSETGRGLFVGMGLTALLQGTAATIGYVVLGIDQAFVLGAMTVVAAIIPSGGAALIWVPVSAALAIGGRPGAAAVMFAIGAVVSTLDNFVRPALSRYGKLRMPTYLLLIAIFGGLAIFGAGGVLLGPLLVRLAIEGLEILREQRDQSA